MTEAVQRDAFLEEFAGTVGADYESAPFLAPRAQGSEALSPVARAIAILMESMRREVLVPILHVKTREEYLERLSGCWKKFGETLAAFRALQRTSMADFSVDDQECMRELRERVRQLSGPDAVSEFDFCVATFNRAMTLARDVGSTPLKDRANAGKDRDLAHNFNVLCDLFQFELFVVSAAAGESRSTSVAVEVSFELLRGSALRAYAAVRQGAELRRSREVPALTTAPFDDEDRFLAGIQP